MDNKQDLVYNIKMIRDQLKTAYRTKNSKHVIKLNEWLNFVETRYDFIIYCEMQDAS